MIDLRAQIEAQARALARAEEQLSKLQTADDPKAFRQRIREMSENNLAIRDLLNHIVEELPPLGDR